MKILNFGSCNIDFVYSVDHFVEPGETLTCLSFNKFLGGKGLNQSIAIAKSGARVYHAGCIGADGEAIKAAFRDTGVDISYLKTADSPTGHAIIEVDKSGENRIIICSGANGEITKEYIDTVISEFDSDTVVVLQNEISNLDYIIASAYKKGMKIVFNPAPFHPSLKSIDLNMLSVLILNETESLGFSNQNTPEAAFKYFRGKSDRLKVIITLGEKGSIFYDCATEKIVYQPAYEVKVVDTTSAGDTFTGYLVSQLSKGEKAENALKTASAAASLATSREGASVSIPTSKEVKESLKRLSPCMGYNFQNDALFKKIKSYFAQNLFDANLDELSKILGYSASYTAAKIKNVTGLSFTEFLRKERSEKAAELLIGTDMAIEKIIEEVGYKNGNFFRKIFKETYGISPLKYRNTKK